MENIRKDIGMDKFLFQFIISKYWKTIIIFWMELGWGDGYLLQFQEVIKEWTTSSISESFSSTQVSEEWRV